MTTICENHTEWNIRDFYKAVSECHSTLNTVHDDAQKDFYKTLMKTAELLACGLRKRPGNKFEKAYLCALKGLQYSQTLQKP
ncbi:MAG: hypothetical protein EB051_01990 [Chlamydiia bacterium]|nr:hypothetical protein [Chlamydiia bacterium]